MGLNFALTKFLIRKKEQYHYHGKILTLGRQDISLTPKDLSELTGTNIVAEGEILNDEGYFKCLGFSGCDSLEYSLNDGATIAHDLNEELPLRLHHKYDFVLDGGTLEHCFSVGTYMASMVHLLKPGGTVIHINPCQGSCNHGFFNFQPTFYFSFYSSNGFQSLELNFLEWQTNPQSLFEDREVNCRVVPVENWNNLDFRTEFPTYSVFKAVKGSITPEPIRIPIQEFYRDIFLEKEKVAGGMIADATYARILGNFPENAYENITKNAYWL